ncbi:MAG: SMC family ATPase [Pyrinomonadaceae bacterium]|nr:SMC family ATPase [Pyrinomonadaceae bacterium]
MHVTRVELEDIKSYERAEFTFERGTTAIVGRNGAGKTTILEAIAWALFDVLDYRKEDFLRRGAKRGSVSVTFESDVDERQYTVHRDTGQRYYVHDPVLNLRLAEGKTDVTAFVHQHLGIEPGTDLKALFRSAIGVPQGSFTAEFLLAPGPRKAAFDRLLKVEEYRESAERLRDTINLIRDRAGEVRERIASVEGQLARYDELIEEHRVASERTGELEQALAALHREADERAEVVSLLDQAERLVRDTSALASRLAIEQSGSERRLAELRNERERAEQALARQRATEADYQAHSTALEHLRELEAERSERDQLRTEAERTAREVMAAESRARQVEEARSRAEGARLTLLELAHEIREQEELERERERLRDLRARSLAARERLVRFDAELENLRLQHKEIRERIKHAEASCGAQTRVEQLESDRIDIETTLSRTSEAATSHKHLLNQRREIVRDAERLRRIVTTLEKEIADLAGFSAKAAEVAQLETRERELSEQLAHLRAEISRDQRMRAEVKGGLCPILSERCLNIGEGQTLESYFADHLATNSAQLNHLEKQHTNLGVATRAAREAEKHSSRIESTQTQLANEHQLLMEREAALARLDQEIAALPDVSPKRLQALKMQLFGTDGELKTAREAVLRYAELEPLKRRLREIETEGKRKKEEHADTAAAANVIASLEQEIADVEGRLRKLNDPRGRAAALRAEAEREAFLEVEAQAARDALNTLSNQSQALEKGLERFAGLDTRWAEASAIRDRTSGAYREHLTSAALAATLPTRQAEVARAEHEAERTAREAAKARRAFESAAASYDSEQHATERGGLAFVRERAAAAGAQLDNARERSEALRADLARLEEVRLSLRDEFRAKERLETLHEATDFVRDILKQAGPLVTESYLYNISIEANQLFREITGEAGRALRWSRDYEIMLEEGGYERSFINLSGGEQMTAALSIRLALLKQLSDIRVAFFDEPTVNMDAERRERLAQQIGQVRHFDQLFVISHDDAFEETVDHVIFVEGQKDEGEMMSAEG